jgi:hypothetical protein
MPSAGGDHGLEGGVAQGLVEGGFNPGGMPGTPNNLGNPLPTDTQLIRQVLVGNTPKAELIIDPQPFPGFNADPDDFPVAFGQLMCHTVIILSPLTGGVCFYRLVAQPVFSRRENSLLCRYFIISSFF